MLKLNEGAVVIQIAAIARLTDLEIGPLRTMRRYGDGWGYGRGLPYSMHSPTPR